MMRSCLDTMCLSICEAALCIRCLVAAAIRTLPSLSMRLLAEPWCRYAYGALQRALELNQNVWRNDGFERRARALADGIKRGTAAGFAPDRPLLAHAGLLAGWLLFDGGPISRCLCALLCRH